MENVIYHIGDIFTAMDEGKHRAMAHGCNCHNNMGAGIAPLVARECPEAYKADQATKKGDKNKLGSFTFGYQTIPDLTHVSYYFNWYTQYNHNRNMPDYPMRNVSYDAVEECALATSIAILNTRELHGDEDCFCMPLIGAGLAGGDWDIIIKLVAKHINKVHVYVLPLERDLKIAFGEDFRSLVFPVKTRGGKWMSGRFTKDNEVVTLGGATFVSAEHTQTSIRKTVGAGRDMTMKEGLVICL